MKAQRPRMPIKAEDIDRIQDFIEVAFAHWDLKKIDLLPIWSHEVDSPTQRLYKIGSYSRTLSGRYLEISFAWITYDGEYEKEDNPNEEIVRFCNRLEKFGYKISNVRNENCPGSYSSKYTGRRLYSNKEPRLEYKQFEVRRNDKEL